MKKILLILLLLLIPSMAPAQQIYSVAPCDTNLNVFKLLADKKEALLFTGNGLMMLSPNYRYYEGTTMLFANQDTGEYSVVQVWPDNRACLLLHGRNFEPYGGKHPWQMTDDLEEES